MRQTFRTPRPAGRIELLGRHKTRRLDPWATWPEGPPLKTVLPSLLVCLLTCAIPAITFTAATAAAQQTPDLPLDVYQKIKADFDALYGANATLVSGLRTRDRQEVERDLRADAAANKDLLLLALHSSAGLKRELAVMALEYCGDKQVVVEALQPLLSGDPESGVRRAVAAVLARLPDAASSDALVKALDDTDDTVRGLSTAALGNIRDNRATAPLLRVLKDDPKPLVRLQSAMALSKIQDESAVKGLKAALDSEADERVKMAIAGALRASMGLEDERAEAQPPVSQTASELSQLAQEMKEIESKLRDDRYDQSVQAQGKGIEDKLSTLIEKLDAQCNSNCSCQKKQSQRQSGSKNAATKSKNAGTPMTDSQLGGPVAQGALVEAFVSSTQDKWAKLQPAQREELFQAFRDDMPEHWKKRLEAYFTSIAAEEAGRK